MANVDPSQKKRNNYKLLVDPELKKGHKKVYRLNGKDVPGFPLVGEPKDPRTQKTVLGVTGSRIDFRLPRFKFDKFWEGTPPERDVFVIGLNDGVKGSLLKEICADISPVHSIKFHRHPKTKMFLGAATVCFLHSGSGQRAVKELDGKIVGGCYLRAELDDNGDHLKKYLEPVLKKCGLDKKPKQLLLKEKDGQNSKESCGRDTSLLGSDSEEIRTRSNSIAESTHELSESEMDPQFSTAATTSTTGATTPLTPTTLKNSDPFLASTRLYPFSILSTSCTPSESSPSIGFGSPSFNNNATNACTPSSIDSGISLRTHSSLLSPAVDGSKSKKTFFTSSAISQPPLPPEENAPPLPPVETSSTPPPLPPLPPAPNNPVSGGIENISSDEEDTIHDRKQSNKILSPVPISPSHSPKRNTGNTNSHVFDPSLSLKTLLDGRALGVNSTPPAMTSTAYESTTASTYIASTSPRPATSNYELEYEEISGDESPVMVHFETISDDDMEAGGDDMEVCSDDENEQDNVIELNVRSSRVYQNGPMLEPPRPHPPLTHPPLPPGPPQDFFLHPLPPMGVPMIPPPLQPLPPGHDFPPPMMLPPDISRHPFDSPLHPFINDVPISRPPNGYIQRSSKSTRPLSKSRMLKNFSTPKNKRESIGQDVLFKAMEQLRLILLNDVHKKIVESSAYPVLDSHWEKRQKEKQIQKPEHGQQLTTSSSSTIASAESADKDKPSQPVEPYRRMLPGMTVKKEEKEENKELAEDEEEPPSVLTPRKRLMNFKIPLVNRGGGQRRDQHHSVVARRRLYGETASPAIKSHTLSRTTRDYFSDISSSEDFSSESEAEGERSSDEEESMDESVRVEESPSSEDEEAALHEIFGSSSEESESDFEAFVAKTKRKPPSRRTSTRSDASSEELPTKTRGKGVKMRAKKATKLKKDEELDLEVDVADTVAGTRTSVQAKVERLLKNKENLSRINEVVSEVKPAPRKPKYKKRSVKMEDEILERFIEQGLDKEDVLMFKLAVGRLKELRDELVGHVPWAHYPHIPPSAPPPKRRRYLDPTESEDHVTGCARSEGYYKIDMREKVKYLPHHRMKNTTTPAQQKKNKSSGRVNRANQRKLASLFSAGDVSSDLAKYNQLKARKKLLKFAKSTIHNWGLFALENIAADEMVIEYVGQMVRQAVADEREKRYEAAGIGSSYLFRVDHDYIIDATRRGNLARFINHCCDPNCYAKVINFGTLKKIVIYSKRDIAMGEEITYDYKFPIEDEKIPCLCGAPNCRGTLN